MVSDPNREPENKTELLERIGDAYADYEAAVNEAGEERLTQPSIGLWSVRDIIAHVGADEQWMAGQVEALHAGQVPTAQACYGEDVSLPQDIRHLVAGRAQRLAAPAAGRPDDR